MSYPNNLNIRDAEKVEYGGMYAPLLGGEHSRPEASEGYVSLGFS
jgi:hypothetical protein